MQLYTPYVYKRRVVKQFTMHFKEQACQLPIEPITEKIVGAAAAAASAARKHGDLFPNTIRCIISGPSNCGKTNVMINLLEHENGLSFKNVYVFSKSLQQFKYKYLALVIQNITEIGYFPFTSNDDVISPDKALPHSIFIFDDIVCDSQDNVRAYFSMGRHYDVDCFYLSQTYSKVPKQLIRDNANVIVLFKQDERNLQHVFNDHVNPDMTFPEFTSLCKEIWNDNVHNFLVISKDDELNNGRYRCNFDKYICINT